MGYFEGPINADEKSATFVWYEFLDHPHPASQHRRCHWKLTPPRSRRYDTPTPPHSASGTAVVQYTSFADNHSVTGTYTGDRDGLWRSLQCARVPGPSPADLMRWCMWSPRTDPAAARAALNASSDPPFPSAYVSFAQGNTNLCHRDAPLAGYYVYSYDRAECAQAGLDCAAFGFIEQGSYEGVAPRGRARALALAGTVGYAGTWYADSGPAAGRFGAYLQVVVWDGAAVRLLGFYCLYDPAARRRSACYPVAFTHAPAQQGACPPRSGLATPLAMAVAVPVLATLLALALALAALRRRRSDRGDGALRAKVEEVRARLRITAADGFRVASDPSPGWGRWLRGAWARAGGREAFLQESAVEAAARLALWADFDLDQVPWGRGAAAAAAGGGRHKARPPAERVPP